MKTEKELGICVRCKKNKATLQYAEGTMAVAHGFVENICQECFDKMQKATPLWKKAIEERNTEVKQAIEKLKLIYEMGLTCKMQKSHKEIFSKVVENLNELLQKLGLEESNK